MCMKIKLYTSVMLTIKKLNIDAYRYFIAIPPGISPVQIPDFCTNTLFMCISILTLLFM